MTRGTFKAQIAQYVNIFDLKYKKKHLNNVNYLICLLSLSQTGVDWDQKVALNFLTHSSPHLTS